MDQLAFQAGVALAVVIWVAARLLKNFPSVSKWILIISALPILLAAIGGPYSTLAGSATTVLSYLFYRRYSGTALSSLADLVTIRFWRIRETRTDVRTAGASLLRPGKNGLLYDVEKYISIAQRKSEIFLGLDADRRPVTIPITTVKKTHIQTMGTTGGGKTVAATLIMAQLIRNGASVIAFDPKDDEFLGPILAAEAEKSERRFFCLDLKADFAAWNPFYRKKPDDIEELFAAGLSIGDRGDTADVYRTIDREFLRDLARYAPRRAVERPDLTANEIWREFSAMDPERRKRAQKISIDLDEIFSVPFCNASGENSINFLEEIQAMSVFYVHGDKRIPKILKLQKMVLLEIMMLIEKRPRDNATHCSIYLDEFKYLLSQASMQALGTIRDKRANVLISHQSLEDCRDVGADINPDAVMGAVVENCRMKFAYESSHFETLELLSRLSGTILIEDETKKIQRNIALGEENAGERTLKINERPLIDINQLRTLPPKHAVLYGVGLAKIIAIEHLQASNKILSPWGTEFSPENIFREEDLIDVTTKTETAAEPKIVNPEDLI